MRIILIFLVCLSLGKGVEALGYSNGFSFTFFSLAVFVFLPIIVTLLRLRTFQRACNRWLKDNGYIYTQLSPEPHMLSKGRLRWKVSDAQLVFSIRNKEDEEFWFSCGSWLFGAITNKVKIYKAMGDKLFIVDTLKV